MNNSPKIAIQASLDELDNLQIQKVLQYIKDLTGHPRKQRDYGAFKLEAMKEIRQALRKDNGLQLTV